MDYSRSGHKKHLGDIRDGGEERFQDIPREIRSIALAIFLSGAVDVVGEGRRASIKEPHLIAVQLAYQHLVGAIETDYFVLSQLVPGMPSAAQQQGGTIGLPQLP